MHSKTEYTCRGVRRHLGLRRNVSRANQVAAIPTLHSARVIGAPCPPPLPRACVLTKLKRLLCETGVYCTLFVLLSSLAFLT